MKKIKLTIDGLDIITAKGKTVLETALENHIYIPHLCYHPDLEPAGVCRLCMVEIGGRLVAACKMDVTESLEVVTQSEAIDKARQVAMELLIVNHDGECLSCEKDSDCQMQEAANYIGIDKIPGSQDTPVYMAFCSKVDNNVGLILLKNIF